MCDYTQITKVFTKSTLLNQINGLDSFILKEAVENFIKDSANSNYSEIYEGLYKVLDKKYRNEYYYKNTMLNKWLFGRYSPNTTTIITEFPMGNSKGDFVVINKKATVYEIKTELDTLGRLEGQLENYYKVFGNVGIVTCEKNEEIIRKKFQSTPVGILVLTKNNRLKQVQKVQEELSAIDKNEIFATLRKNEYEQILRLYYGKLPDVSAFKYYDSCREWFLKIELDVIYKSYYKILKARRKIRKEIYSVPSVLKLLCYDMELQEGQYKRLMSHLYSQYREG